MDKADGSFIEEELTNKDTSQATVISADGRKRKRLDFSAADGEMQPPSYLVRLLWQVKFRLPKLTSSTNCSCRICNILKMEA